MGLLDRALGAVARAEDVWRARPRGLRPLQPQSVATQGGWFWPGWGEVALPNITEATVLGLPAAWRAVRLIAEGVAAMAPPRVLAADGVTELPGPWPIVDRPSASYGVTEFWSMCVAHMVTSGSLVGVLADADPVTGWMRQVVPVPTPMVNGYYDDDGFPRFDIGDRTYTADEVVLVRHHCIPGRVMGVGAVEAFRRSLGASSDQVNYAANTWRSGAVPSGIIKVARPEVSKEQADDVADQWIERHGAGNRRPAVLSEMFDFTPISWSPADSEFLSSRQFSVAEIALMFDLDPSDLGASIGGTSLTYANLSQRQSARVVEALGPRLARFEDAWSDLTPGGNKVRFRRENLLHASRADLFAEQAIGIAAGVLTVEEARAEANKPPLEPEPEEAEVVDDAPEPAQLALPPAPEEGS